MERRERKMGRRKVGQKMEGKWRHMRVRGESARDERECKKGEMEMGMGMGMGMSMGMGIRISPNKVTSL